MNKDEEITLETNRIIEDAEKRLKHLFPEANRIGVVMVVAHPDKVGTTYLTSNLEVDSAKGLLALNVLGKDELLHATKETKG